MILVITQILFQFEAKEWVFIIAYFSSVFMVCSCQGNLVLEKVVREGQTLRSPGPLFSWSFGPAVEFESHIQSTPIRQPNLIT